MGAQATSGSDGVTDLVAAVEAQYRTGLALFRSGQLDEARRAFDDALEHLLGSSYDIRATPPLQAELDSLRDRIAALESDTLASGGLNPAQSAVSPLARIPELTFPLDAATRALVEREAKAALAAARPETAIGAAARLALDIPLNEAVLRYVHYFTTTGKADLLLGFRRAGRYRAIAEQDFAAAGVPLGLYYMAQLESNFNPREGTVHGARGMWQFEPSRAADYDLKRTEWVDQRMDPEKSTLAAAHHLKDLYAEFGNWLLAMAAYNAGPATVQRAVARTGYADFWKLAAAGALPRGVRSYVPIVLALDLIARDPQQYGLDSVTPDPPLAVDHVTLTAATDLRLAADCAEVTVEDLRLLNPGLLHLRAPGGYDLKLPEGAEARFSHALSLVPAADRLAWRVAWVRPGESWGQLSRQFGISKVRLAGANHLSEDTPPAEGMPLAIPAASGGRRASATHKAAKRAVKK